MAETVFVIPDVHCPYEDSKALDLVLEIHKDLKPSLTVIIGDFCDFYSISNYRKNPHRNLNLRWEVDQVNKQLDRIETENVVFLEGNHEDRLRRFLQDKAPELFGLTEIGKLFRLEERGWKHVEYGDYFTRGKVTYVHDLGHSGKYALHQTIQTAGGNVVFGHTHRGGIVYEGHVGSGGHFALNVGWLGNYRQLDYKSKFKAQRDFRLGFGLIEEESGLYFPSFYPIVKGKSYVRGKLYG